MRVLFLGTPEFSVPALAALIESHDFEVVGVITQPDRKAGRGLKLLKPPVKRFALENAIRVFQPERIRDNREVRELLETLKPTINVVVAFGQILPEEFFSFPEFGTLNIHASILPAYRGAAPIAHALLNGEPVTGVTIMKIDAGMDTGDVLSIAEVSVDSNMTAGDLERSLAKEGAKLLIPSMRDYVAGRIRPVPQDHSRASYAPRLTRQNGKIDWEMDAHRIHDQVRAMNPWPGAMCRWRGQVLKLWRTNEAHWRDSPVGIAPGMVIDIRDEAIIVRCSPNTALAIKELQLPDKKRMSARNFVNGQRVEVGEVLA